MAPGPAATTAKRVPNGWRTAMATAAGTGSPVRAAVELPIQRLRTGSCVPSFLGPRRSVAKVLKAVIQAACAYADSTRSMAEMTSCRPRVARQRFDCKPQVGRHRHLEEPGQSALQRNRRAGQSLHLCTDRRRLALPVDRRAVPGMATGVTLSRARMVRVSARSRAPRPFRRVAGDPLPGRRMRRAVGTHPA